MTCGVQPASNFYAQSFKINVILIKKLSVFLFWCVAYMVFKLKEGKKFIVIPLLWKSISK